VNACSGKENRGGRRPYADIGVSNNDVEAGLDTLRGTGGEEDVIRVGGVPIALLDELGNIAANLGDTLRVTVGTHAPNGVTEGGGPADGIRREQLGNILASGGIQQIRDLQQGAHLSNHNNHNKRQY